MRLFKRESGILYEDNFTHNEGWALTHPRLINIEDGMRIKPSAADIVRASRKMNDEANMMIAKVNYTPTKVGDKGGMTLFNSPDEAVNMIEFVDDVEGTLEEMRIQRDGNTWKLEMKRGIQYEHIGSVEHNFKNIGFLRYPTIDGEKFEVGKYLELKSRRVIINQVPEGMVAMLFHGRDVDTDRATEDELLNFYLDDGYKEGATIRIYNGDELILEQSVDFYGGDVYSLGTYLQMYHDGELLQEFDPHKLGRITPSGLVVKLELHNPAKINANDVNLSVERYMESIGYEWTDVSLNEEGPYDKDLHFDVIAAGESVYFYVRMDKEGIIPDDNIVYFTIYVEHS